MRYQKRKPSPIKMLIPIVAPLVLLLIYELYASGTVTDILREVNRFATENRYVVWPIVGAIMMIYSSIRKIGVANWMKANHPIQGIVGVGIIGALGGLIIAWALTLIFH